MKVATANVHPFAIEELACQITGLDYDEIDANTEVIEQKLIDEFDISLEAFHEIIERLLPLVSKGNSGLTGKGYKGFAVEDDGIGRWIVKTELTN